MVTRKVKSGYIGCSIGSFDEGVLIQCQYEHEQARVLLTIKQAKNFIKQLEFQIKKAENNINEK